MKVILLENVEDLGSAGDIVDVADGHARNYLFPRGLAAAATGHRIREAEERKSQGVKTAQDELAAMQRLAESVDRQSVRLERPLGPQGKFHGAVTAEDIAAAIESALAVRLPRGVVQLPEPLREPMTATVTLAFPHGLEADVTVIVEGTSVEDTSHGGESS